MPGFFDDDDVAAAKGSGFFDAEDSAPLAPNPQAQPAAVSRITDFSPDAIAETTQQLRSDRQAKLNGIGTGTSATRGIAQGATMGFADELTGLGEGAYRAITEPDTSFGDAYTQARDESRAAYGDAQEANPMSYMAGEVGAGLATMAIPGLGAGNAARGVAGAARAAPAAVEVAGDWLGPHPPWVARWLESLQRSGQRLRACPVPVWQREPPHWWRKPFRS